MQAISALTRIYGLARRSGLLDTRAGQSLFIAAYFQYKKRLEDPFDGLIARHPKLFRGGHILDVGANIGYCSTLFARALDAGRNVFAFEPEPFNVSLLERVIRAQGCDAVVAVQAAVGAEDGTIQLKLNPWHHGDHRVVPNGGRRAGATIQVPLLSIDRFLESRNAAVPVRLIKIDVQGYELAVCKGAGQTLARNPGCSVVLEYMPEAIEALGFRPAELLRWFEERDYYVYEVKKDGSLTRGVPLTQGPRGYVDLLFSRNEPAG